MDFYLGDNDTILFRNSSSRFNHRGKLRILRNRTGGAIGSESFQSQVSSEYGGIKWTGLQLHQCWQNC